MSNLHLSVSVSVEQVIELVRQLSPADKIKIREELVLENDTIPIEHQAIVHERMLKSKKDKSRLLDWDEVSAAL
jgi:hypothetical protein